MQRLEVSGAVRPINGSLGIKRLMRSRDHTQAHHTRYYSSGRVIGPPQRPLPDNTQHETDIHAYSGIRTRNRSKQAATDLRLKTARPQQSAT